MDCVCPVGGVGPSGSSSHLPPYSQQLEAQHYLTPVDDPPSDDDNGNLDSQTMTEVNLDAHNGCELYLPVSWFSTWILEKNILISQKLNNNTVYMRTF